jgi:hypothetical protein
MPSPLLGPVVALVAWSLLIWVWMYATRLPAMARMKMRTDNRRPRGEQMSELPPEVRWKADNYNHLMEQPTLYYAVTLAFAASGRATATDLMLAWAYVGTRVAHSLVQTTVNVIPLRFVLFALGSLVLIALTVRAALAVF